MSDGIYLGKDFRFDTASERKKSLAYSRLESRDFPFDKQKKGGAGNSKTTRRTQRK